MRLPLSHADFLELPRHPAYRYEYLEGHAYISPLPRYYHCLLDLAAGPTHDGQTRSWEGQVRPLSEEDWSVLPRLFASGFYGVEPFAGLSDLALEYAGRMALERTRIGDDGPLIAPACFVAERDGEMLGAGLVTLLPLRDPTAWNAYCWSSPPPEDAVERCLGRPHLTWIFVRSHSRARGVGSALLRTLCEALRQMGYRELLSTFLEGNTTSMLWHWRNGFTLLQNPDSYRRTTRANDWR
jgi:GNAT superfamily N-acetyltransferase